MAVSRRRMSHPPAAVRALLADASRYAEWVVGAKRIRKVDPAWPAVGSTFHHTVGVGPLATRDTTEVLAHDPDGGIVLKARAWPAGSARVAITPEHLPDGRCEVVIDEVPIEGPAKALHNPVLEGITHLRNIESLRRMEQALDRQV